MLLEGHSALVTGAGVRLGKTLALALAERHVKVAVHYHSSSTQALETVSQIEEMGGKAEAIRADLSVPGEAASLVNRAVERLGSLDILVNSAAIFQPAGLHNTTRDHWERHFAINLASPFFLSQAFADHVGTERKGAIVNIADWRGLRPDTEYLAYSLTKAGILAMTKGLALALAPNIRVNAIAPGAILPPPGEGTAYLEGLAQEIPLQHVGSPVDIASALCYLLESEFVTGQTIFVTGGQHLV